MRFALAGGLAYFDAVLDHLNARGIHPERVYRTEHTTVTKELLKRHGIDLLICMGYPHILKRDVLNFCTCLNLHTSLLPRHRGRHPMNWAMVQGDKEVGITLHKMAPGIDTGPIVYQERVPVDRDDDLNDLHAKLIPIGIRMVKQVIGVMRDGWAPLTPQHGKATYDRKRTPEDGRIDWSKSATEISNLTNALVDPMPNAFCSNEKGRTVRFTRSWRGKKIGEVVVQTLDGRYIIAAADGLLLVTTDRPLRVGEVLR